MREGVTFFARWIAPAMPCDVVSTAAAGIAQTSALIYGIYKYNFMLARS